MFKTSKKIVQGALQMVGLEIGRRRSTGSKNGHRDSDPIYSNLDEQSIVNRYLKLLSVNSGYCVDIGASDGLNMSNTYALYRDGWAGLAVESDAQKFSTLADRYDGCESVNLAKCKVSPENVIALLSANEVPKAFEFLNLDIDGYDYYVLEEVLNWYRPRLICVEINEKIPPPIKFTVNWDPAYAWAEDHLFGQSISQLHLLATTIQYALVELHYSNAFLIPMEFNFKSLTPEEAYQSGYLCRPDRKIKFPWNSNMEEVLHMQPVDALAYITKFFEKYEGMFQASI